MVRLDCQRVPLQAQDSQCHLALRVLCLQRLGKEKSRFEFDVINPEPCCCCFFSSSSFSCS